jgi:hypothetical protein
MRDAYRRLLSSEVLRSAAIFTALVLFAILFVEGSTVLRSVAVNRWWFLVSLCAVAIGWMCAVLCRIYRRRWSRGARSVVFALVYIGLLMLACSASVADGFGAVISGLCTALVVLLAMSYVGCETSRTPTAHAVVAGATVTTAFALLNMVVGVPYAHLLIACTVGVALATFVVARVTRYVHEHGGDDFLDGVVSVVA